MKKAYTPFWPRCRKCSLNARTPNLVIAGTGPERDALEELALSLGDRVSFTGFLDEADKSLLLQRAELCIFPSLYEPFGLVALEAMASGTPLIVSDTGGLAEIVSHGVNGCTCPPGDSECVSRTNHSAFGTTAYASKLASTALRTVHSEYNWEKIGSLTTHVYEAVISQSGCINQSFPASKGNNQVIWISVPNESVTSKNFQNFFKESLIPLSELGNLLARLVLHRSVLLA